MRRCNQASDAIRVQSSIEEELIIKDQLHFPMNEIALEEMLQMWRQSHKINVV